MNIGELAKLSGVSAKNIRHYESSGIIPKAIRSGSGYRVYRDTDVQFLSFVKRARSLGFSMKEIKKLMGLWRNQSRSSRDVKTLALEHIEALELKIRETQLMVENLRRLANSCHGDSRPACPILEDLGGMRKLALVFLLLTPALAQGEDELFHSPEPADCGHMEVWDPTVGMCAPFPMAGMPMKMLMVHGNSFFTQVLEEKPRGRNAFAVPDMFMADFGSSLGDRHYLNLDFMGTVEKWTLPQSGYPEFLQIGENDASGRPFVDAQHPHSSPVMGLTLSDTIALGSDKDHAKIWFAPRGQSTDGPVAFMHRPTGMVNPDAPLGHHIGQDVGHISSTVAGASLHVKSSTVELSTFHGEEPEPTKVDLPLGTPDSYAARFIYQFHEHFFAMGSAAFVNKPEPSDSALDHVWRFSASLYHDAQFESDWVVHSALIWGMIKNYDRAASLTSFAGEAWAERNADNLWTRVEVLQRTPAELLIGTGNQGRWVMVPTLGYTRKIARWENADLGLGGSVTKDFLPAEIGAAYGGNPWSGKVFLQLSGMKMWEL